MRRGCGNGSQLSSFHVVQAPLPNDKISSFSISLSLSSVILMSGSGLEGGGTCPHLPRFRFPVIMIKAIVKCSRAGQRYCLKWNTPKTKLEAKNGLNIQDAGDQNLGHIVGMDESLHSSFLTYIDLNDINTETLITFIS